MNPAFVTRPINVIGPGLANLATIDILVLKLSVNVRKFLGDALARNQIQAFVYHQVQSQPYGDNSVRFRDTYLLQLWRRKLLSMKSCDRCLSMV